MARTMLNNRISVPGLNRKQQNKFYDEIQLQINEIDEQQAEQAKQQAEQLERVRGQMTGAAPGADIMGAARQAPAVQAAEEQRAVDEARLRVVTPEVEGIQRLGQTPDYSPAQALRQSYETRKASEQQDEDLVQGLLAKYSKV
jgi:FtsZ-interacting cell division protein ZipA